MTGIIYVSATWDVMPFPSWFDVEVYGMHSVYAQILAARAGLLA